MATAINEYDLICVGAGVVGCAAAKAFGSDGRKVLLLERDLTEPDRIVGELMQPGGVNALKTLGLEDCVEDIDGIPCYGYSVFRDGELVEIPYPDDQDTGKKARGISFHHGRFIQKLRKEASNTKNVTVKEMTVTRLVRDEGDDKVMGVVAQTKDGKEETFYGSLTFVADGIFSKFRKEFTTKMPDVRSHFVGFLMKDLELPLPQHGCVVLAKPSPVLMYQIGTHETRVLVDVPGELPSVTNGDLKKYLQNSIAPQLPEAIRIKFLEGLETERLRTMPNGFLPPSTNTSNGAALLGDAMNIRHPLTGGGMTVALNDVILLRELLNKENVPSFADTDLIIQSMDAFHWKRKKYCTAINVLAMSLYRLFAANDPNLQVLQRGCFSYFQLGGDCIDGPVSLLAGLAEKPLLLVYHFFAVAFYAIWLQYGEGGLAKFPHNFIKMFTVLYTACVTILPYLWSETQD
ncbi:Squalene epoxidase [Apophysomyces sp. BC1034]|nr:Squalene epoxidase [Apophysomyces sp. BC1015]KAG0178247.1 Squalene epoxidase [Apophysomyces sp. BC1021]KAG0190056.1 Squalene epoxidase [Apophysomyces sp. BC1034]